MIIDSHIHVVGKDRNKYPIKRPPVNPSGMTFQWYDDMPISAEGMIPLMKEAGVDKANLVQPMSAYRNDNNYIVDAGAKYPGMFTSVGIVDMKPPDAGEKLRYWVTERGMAGLRLFLTLPGGVEQLQDPKENPIWNVARELQVPVFMQMHHSALPNLTKILEQYPEILITLDHIASLYLTEGPPLEVIRPLLDMAIYPNLYIKFSILNEDALRKTGGSRQVLETLVETFGARRMMWGSNFPATYDRPYKEIVDRCREALAVLPESDQHWILGETALAIWPQLHQSSTP